MKKSLIILALLLVLSFFASVIFAQEINPNDTVTAEYIVATRSVPVPLGQIHISAGPLGYYTTLDPSDFRISSLGIDCSNGPSMFLNFRNSFSQIFDVAFNIQHWGSVSEEYGIRAELDVLSYGIGLRAVTNEFSKSRIYPFVQGNLYLITEKVTVSFLNESDDDDAQGYGFGFDVGVEIKVKDRFSIPAEVRLIYGTPADDVSGFGFYTGISYNWGDIERPMHDN